MPPGDMFMKALCAAVIFAIVLIAAVVIFRLFRRKQRLLEEVEECFSATFEQAAVGMAHVAIDGTWLRVNSKLCDITGYSRDELMGLTFQNITHPDDLVADLESLHLILDGKIQTCSMDKRYIRKDGSPVWICLTVSLARDQKGFPEYFIAVIKDISDRKLAESELDRYKEHLQELIKERTNELSSAEERFRLFFKNSIAAMLIISSEGEMCEVNPEACRLFQITESDFRVLKLEDLIDQTDARFKEALKSCADNGVFHGELTLKRNDGTSFPALVSLAVFHEPSGIGQSSMVIRDVSDQKRTEEALRASEAQLKEAQQIAHIGHWELNFMTETVTWSDEIYNIYEVDPDKFEASFDTFFNLLSPMEREKVGRAGIDTELNKNPYEIVHRFNFPGGRIKYVNETCQNFYDETGKLIRSVGTVQDITARWITEERLRQLSRAVEQSPVCVVITDLEGIISYVNPRFSELTGYSYDEALGQNPRILKSHITPKETFVELWKNLKAGTEWRGEFCNKKKNGEYYWEMAYISPVVDMQGNSTHFVAVKEDITARKLAEVELRELSLSDDLTGLSNRRGFMHLAKQQLKVSDRNRKGLVLIFADLDKMKWINDTFGHAEGDWALIYTAGILKRSFRVSDIISRLGGDEFVVLSVEAPEKSEGHIMDRLQENLQAHNMEAGRPYKLSISFGITTYNPEEPCTLDELIERGDKLMYEQKQKKKLKSAGSTATIDSRPAVTDLPQGDGP